MRHKPSFIRRMVNGVIELLEETRTVTKTARELLFEGYDDKLLEIAHKLNVSDTIPYTKFGWFHGVSKYIFMTT